MKKIYLLTCLSIASLNVSAQTALKISKNNVSIKSTELTRKSVSSNKAAAAVTGNIVCNTQYAAGTSQLLTFLLTPTNSDGEYIDSLAITFPAGVTPTGSPNNPFAPITDNGVGQTPEALNPISGQTISWGDDDNNYGGIETLLNAGGVTSYTFGINVTVAPGTTGSLTATFFASGDGFGASPANLSGTITLFPAGALLPNYRTVFAQPSDITQLSECNLGLDTIIGLVKNVGGTTDSNIIVSCTVNGVAQTPVTITSALSPGDSIFVRWLPGFNFNASSLYSIIAYTSVVGDINKTNDTSKLTFVNTVPTALTSANFTNGCEAGYEYNSLIKDFVSGAPIVFGPSNATIQSGLQALFYTVAANATPLGTHEAMVILPCVDVTSGETYKISFYKRSNAALSGNGQSAVFTGLSNNAAAMTTILKPYSAITPQTVWIKDSATFTATATETRYFALGGKGTNSATTQVNVRYDNIVISKVTASSGLTKVEAKEIKISPNPSNGLFNVNIISNNTNVEVYNLVGQLVYNTTAKVGNLSLNLKDLSKGTYFVKFSNENSSTTKKLVIE